MSLYLIRDLLRVRRAVEVDCRRKVDCLTAMRSVPAFSRELLLAHDFAGFAWAVDLPILLAHNV